MTIGTKKTVHFGNLVHILNLNCLYICMLFVQKMYFISNKSFRWLV